MKKVNWISVLVTIFLVVLFVVCCTTPSSDPDDNGAMNLFWVIFILLAFLKGPGD